MLGLLEGPKVGGDTVFAGTDAAFKQCVPEILRYQRDKCADSTYRRLSPIFHALIDSLHTVYLSSKIINHACAAGGLV